MATGYCHMLQDMNFDVDRWLKEKLIRGMGICFTIRDESNDMTQQDIAKALRSKKFSPHEDDYHQRSLADAIKEKTEIEARTPADWETLYVKEKKEAEIDYESALKDYHAKKANYEKTQERLNTLFIRATEEQAGEVVLGAISFAQEQVEMSFPNPPYRDSILDQTLETFVIVAKDRNVQNIEYHSKHLKEMETKKEKFDYPVEYDKFCEFIDSTP